MREWPQRSWPPDRTVRERLLVTQNLTTVETSEAFVMRIKARGWLRLYSMLQIDFMSWKYGDEGLKILSLGCLTMRSGSW